MKLYPGFYVKCFGAKWPAFRHSMSLPLPLNKKGTRTSKWCYKMYVQEFPMQYWFSKILAQYLSSHGRNLKGLLGKIVSKWARYVLCFRLLFKWPAFWRSMSLPLPLNKKGTRTSKWCYKIYVQEFPMQNWFSKILAQYLSSHGRNLKGLLGKIVSKWARYVLCFRLLFMKNHVLNTTNQTAV